MELDPDPPTGRKPCPACGSMARTETAVVQHAVVEEVRGTSEEGGDEFATFVKRETVEIIRETNGDSYGEPLEAEHGSARKKSGARKPAAKKKPTAKKSPKKKPAAKKSPKKKAAAKKPAKKKAPTKKSAKKPRR
jgi:hypothetical protein